MTENWDNIDYWIETLEEEESDRMNSWEVDFIDSISLRAQNRWDLSEAQIDKLKQIYSKYTKRK